jgi:hypothetical protein
MAYPVRPNGCFRSPRTPLLLVVAGALTGRVAYMAPESGQADEEAALNTKNERLRQSVKPRAERNGGAAAWHLGFGGLRLAFPTALAVPGPDAKYIHNAERSSTPVPSDMKAAIARCLRCIIIPRIVPTNPPDAASTPQQKAHSILTIPSGICVLPDHFGRTWLRRRSADCLLSAIRSRHCLPRPGQHSRHSRWERLRAERPLP